jgi:hypothetical protein
MSNNGFGWLAIVRQPWAWLVSLFGGAMAWAVGCSAPQAAATAAVMLGTAVMVGGVSRRQGASRVGTRQHGLIMLFDGHVRSLRTLQGKALPEVVRFQADQALAAADAARPSVVQMAAAVDAIDEAIALACNVSGRGQHAAVSISRTVGRLQSRRERLVEKLTAAVDEVATVYAGLLELSATARTMGVALDDGEVGAVNDAVTLLQMTFAELEADAAKLVNEGLGERHHGVGSCWEAS